MPGRGRRGGGWQGRFAAHGYRMTLSREVILDVVNRTDKHLSAEEIYLEVHKKHPSSGMSTVYRTLELLTQLGIINKSDFGDGRARYELNRRSEDKKYHHHHLVCMNCRRVIDYTEFSDDEVELLRRTERTLVDKYKFKIVKHVFQFYGLCEACQTKENSGGG